MSDWVLDTPAEDKPTKDSWVLDDKPVAPQVNDVGPEARRAKRGAAPTPQPPSDESLGLDPGPVKSYHTGPTVSFLARLLGDSSGGQPKFPTNASEGANRDKLVALTEAGESLRQAERTIGAGALAGPLSELGSTQAATVVPGALAKILGAGASGAVTTAVADAKLEHIAEGAALGAAFKGGSDLMQFVINRVAAPSMAREVAKAGGEKLAGLSHDDLVDVVTKYKLGSIKNPQVAKEAVEAGLKRAASARDRAWEAARSASGDLGDRVDLSKNSLVKQALNEFNSANREMQVLKAMQPVVMKVAAADALRPTMLGRLADGVGMAAKRGLPYAVGAGAYHALKGDGK